MRKINEYHLGLFRKICGALVMGELLQSIGALYSGEKHPLIFFINDQNKAILTPDFLRLNRLLA